MAYRYEPNALKPTRRQKTIMQFYLEYYSILHMYVNNNLIGDVVYSIDLNWERYNDA